jgi:hypothetical protein
MSHYFAAVLVIASTLWLLRQPNRPLAGPWAAPGVEAGAPVPVPQREVSEDDQDIKGPRALLIERTSMHRRNDGSTSEVVHSSLWLGDGEARLAALDRAEGATSKGRSVGERNVAGIPCVGSRKSVRAPATAAAPSAEGTVEEWRSEKTQRLVRSIATYAGGARTETVDFYLLSPRQSTAMLGRAKKTQP